MNQGNTAQHQQAGRAAAQAKQAAAQARIQALLEDLEFLMHPDLGGETNPDVIAARVGYTKKTSLARILHRHGHHELGRQFWRTAR
jgi:hypothetical protein